MRNFVLGTANLGMKYGISNTKEPNENESLRIIEHAFSLGIKSFDTAPNYGAAETFLGRATNKLDEVEITTKIPKLNEYTSENVLASLDKSLEKLGRRNVDTLLFHDPEIYRINGLKEITERVLGSEKVKQIGFSAYKVEDVERAKERYPDWKAFQIPENIADRRCLQSSVISNMALEGNTFTTRSTFLQGILLMQPEKISPQFGELRDFVFELNRLAVSFGAEVLDLCLQYSLEIPWSDRVLVAAETKEQLSQINSAKTLDLDFNELPQVDPRYLDPRNWAKL